MCDSNGQIENLKSNFTSFQLNDYCKQYNFIEPLCGRLKSTVDYTHIVFGVIGIPCYIIMLFIYRMKPFQSVSFTYHRAIVYMELVHMVVMIQSGIFMSRGFSDSTYIYVLYRTTLCEFWIIGDAMKLSGALITTFLSFERTAAIYSIGTFELINRLFVARIVIAVSLLFGLLHFSPVISGTIVRKPGPNETIFVVQDNPTGVKVNNVSWEIIYVLKILTAITIMIFCIMIVAGLIVKSKKSQAMSTTAKEKWVDCKRLCAMQLVLGVLCMIDHSVWVSNKLLKYDSVNIVGIDALTQLDYQTALIALNNKLMFHVTWVFESMTGELDHSLRFFIYLVCVKSFRDAFVELKERKLNSIYPSRIIPSSVRSTQGGK